MYPVRLLCLSLCLILPASAVSHQATGFVYQDVDRDGIPNVTERQLLARFTPYLRFSLDGGEEQFRPMDVWQYVQWSELQSDGDEGEGILTLEMHERKGDGAAVTGVPAATFFARTVAENSG